MSRRPAAKVASTDVKSKKKKKTPSPVTSPSAEIPEHSFNRENDDLALEIEGWNQTWTRVMSMLTTVVPFPKVFPQTATGQRAVLEDLTRKVCDAAKNPSWNPSFQNISEKLDRCKDKLYAERGKNDRLAEGLARGPSLSGASSPAASPAPAKPKSGSRGVPAKSRGVPTSSRPTARPSLRHSSPRTAGDEPGKVSYTVEVSRSCTAKPGESQGDDDDVVLVAEAVSSAFSSRSRRQPQTPARTGAPPSARRVPSTAARRKSGH